VSLSQGTMYGAKFYHLGIYHFGYKTGKSFIVQVPNEGELQGVCPRIWMAFTAHP